MEKLRQLYSAFMVWVRSFFERDEPDAVISTTPAPPKPPSGELSPAPTHWAPTLTQEADPLPPKPMIPRAPGRVRGAHDDTKRHYKRKNRSAVSSETLSALLDNLEKTFDTVKLPAMPTSFVDRDLRVGLRRLGPHIPFKRLAYLPRETEDPCVNITPDMKWSSMIFMSLAASSVTTQDELRKYMESLPQEQAAFERDWGSAAFLFAVRCNKLPWHVDPIPNAVAFYQCGVAYNFGKTKELMWCEYHLGVEAVTGKVRVVPELCLVPVHPGPRAQGYTQKRRLIRMAYGQGWGTNEYIRRMLGNDFVLALNWWHEKASMWSVAVRQDGDRVTFCIPPRSAKDYFADRGKTALSATGRRRPIIHLCSEHDRITPTGKTVHIREHVKGLRTFDWRGFSCAVNTPDYHDVTSYFMDLKAADSDEAHGEDLIYASKLGKIISDREDAGHRLGRREASHAA